MVKNVIFQHINFKLILMGPSETLDLITFITESLILFRFVLTLIRGVIKIKTRALNVIDKK